MRVLLLGELGLGLIILVGPTDASNRLAGLASLAVTMVISAFVATSWRAREYKLGLLAATTIILAAVALPSADAYGIRNPLAQRAASALAVGSREHAVPHHLVGLATAVPTLFLIALAGFRGHPVWLRALWLLGGVSGGLIVLASDSRVAWLAIAAAGLALVAAVFVPSRRAGAAVAVAVALCAGLAVRTWLGDDVSLVGREQLWRLGLDHVGASPLLGLGLGGLADLYRTEVPEAGTNAHNLVVQTLGDFGSLGLVVIVTLLVWSVATAFEERLPRATFAGFIACVTFLLVAGMAESIIDATAAFATGNVTIVLPLLFAVLAVPVSCRRALAVRHPPGAPDPR